jgi:RNA polymerase sigma-70 factor, ECF subfamily
MEETDARLVELARGGDAEAFSQLARRHLRSAYLAALAVLVHPQDAEDAAQDAVIKALERIEQCRHPEQFGSWLRQIARNRARNVRRSRNLRRVLTLGSVLQVPGKESPQRDLRLSGIRDDLLDGLGRITEIQREVVLLHDLEGWRHTEIASALGLPEGTVRSHLFHARKALRKLLQGELILEDRDG